MLMDALVQAHGRGGPTLIEVDVGHVAPSKEVDELFCRMKQALQASSLLMES
jgi:hypothetical protein